MAKTVWVLTEEYNQYDQYDEYFLCVFDTKPTVDDLIKSGVCYAPEHVFNGGGRRGYEQHWQNLREVECKN